MRTITLASLLLTIVVFGAFAQPIASDSFFQVRYAANLSLGESYIDIVNTGANGAPLLGPGLGGSVGNLCLNVYAFDPGEEMISCCSCLVTPDQVVNLGVNRDLTSKTLTGVIPPSVTIKLVSTLAGANGSGTTCSNSAALSGGATPAGALTENSAQSFLSGPVAGGFAAWGTTLHAGQVSGTLSTTETAFTPSTMSASEFASLGGRCAAIIGNASTFGICASCRAGALGATKQ